MYLVSEETFGEQSARNTIDHILQDWRRQKDRRPENIQIGSLVQILGTTNVLQIRSARTLMTGITRNQDQLIILRWFLCSRQCCFCLRPKVSLYSRHKMCQRAVHAWRCGCQRKRETVHPCQNPHRGCWRYTPFLTLLSPIQ